MGADENWTLVGADDNQTLGIIVMPHMTCIMHDDRIMIDASGMMTSYMVLRNA